MDAKNLLVSCIAIVAILALTATVAAAPLAEDVKVEVDGVLVYLEGVGIVSEPGVDAGSTLEIEVAFKALVTESHVTVQVEIEGDKVDVEAESREFNVEEGKRYVKRLSIRVPYELKDDLSDDINLVVEIDGEESNTELDDIPMRVQRPSYNANIMSISTPQSVDAGETLAVDIVLKNRGYENLDDVYVTARVPGLGIERNAYFGDIVALECDEDDTDLENYGVDVHGAEDRKCNEDDEDTVSGRILLDIPFGVNAGAYTVEVIVENDDTTSNAAAQVKVMNEFSGGTVIVSTSSRTVAAGEDAEYSILIVNPTDKLKVYRVVTESSGDLSSSAEETVVAVPAGSSKTVTVSASSNVEGNYNFNVNIFSGANLVETVTLSAKVEGESAKAGATQVTSPIVVLTIILAIIFLVLLVVLIVLLGKKPEKSEEFGESYY